MAVGDDTRNRATRQTLRRDAAGNRERILKAAALAFGERGLAASMEDIARMAGVGPATLYRRFPTKDALVATLVSDFHNKLVRLAEEATNRPPGEGLEQFLRTAGWHLAASRGFLPRAWTELARREHVRHLRDLTAGLLRQAQEAGVANDQLTVTDVALAIWSLRGVIETAGTIAPDAWQRHLDVIMAGFRAANTDLPHRPVTLGQLERITTGRG
ncbi:TetR/AcrR family transcriptional regulator [Amycolatopsis sp. K13G38]|uniref:TetR/AcrR family transcriptional regulator n=1 Tax=Amycolatopsis acididurans TaxID=2724524 RepID=A0ABX1J8P1_9PSEU|nr:TetR/AcrR family transcriptional regulator [Amycolatopsis acididurans]NKQ56078.1 TetR/AcrR family transcriptional regulator [Amycolatopsis acididurans]